MELIERDDFLAILHNRFKQTANGEGHSFFVTGEAGIGKTSLVKAFVAQVEKYSIIYTGHCDSLFTPRPLAPLYDLSLQMKGEWMNKIQSLSSRAALFTGFLQALMNHERPVILFFEDVHWADEATLDFIRFLSRRINLTRCLFVLTYRDHELGQQHPLRYIPGDLEPGIFTHLMLTPLSRQAVQKMAGAKGYDGEDVFSISGGNPFYVNEILASYSEGIPDNVRNAILTIYNRQEEKTKKVWQLLSVIPEGLELLRLAAIDHSWQEAVEDSLAKKILILDHSKIFFKHELYRRTIEGHLSPFRRIELNKYILELFLKDFEESSEIERIVHYAKNSNENTLVLQYAPLAAKKAASVGAHIESSRLLLTAIEYGSDKETGKLVTLYEDYAYECYLTNQVKNAIIYLGKALKIREGKNEKEQAGNNLRFLSRLWWFEGDRRQAENFARAAIDVLDPQPASRAKAMAYSNMSQLKLLADQSAECIFWGEKAFAMAKELGDQESVAHALNSMGSTLMLQHTSLARGIELLEQSLAIALQNAYHEHVARAYTALGSNGVTIKNYPFAKKMLEQGIHYCEERDLDSLKFYMLGWKARLYLETGHWKEAAAIAESLVKNDNLLPVTKIGASVVIATIKMRSGQTDALPLLLETKSNAFETIELQRIIPVLLALLEYEWITGNQCIDDESFARVMEMFRQVKKISKKSRLYFWLRKSRKESLLPDEEYEDDDKDARSQEADLWEKCGCPYEQALTLFEGGEEDKRKALLIIQQLGAAPVYGKMKQEMRFAGIKKIPRGTRESTKSNAAQLTKRELDVLFLLKKGIQNKEIAETLFISPKTVDHHISAILFKLEVSSRMKAVAEAGRLGIIL